MASVQPKIAYAQTLLALSGVVASSAYTCTFVMTHGWEAHIPVRAIQNSSATVPPEVRVYRDCGGAFETDPISATKFVFPYLTSSDKTVSIKLNNGIYAVVLISGSHLCTMGLFTQYIITSVDSV